MFRKNWKPSTPSHMEVSKIEITLKVLGKCFIGKSLSLIIIKQ